MLTRSARNVVWLGDFNYRISLSNEDVRRAVKGGQTLSLLKYDQLCVLHSGGDVFSSFTEGDISFAPTYKYDIGTDRYDTSEKQRVPSWTDRILYKGESVSCVRSRIDSDSAYRFAC